LPFIGVSQNNITITDEESHNADESAVLDIYSTSKGMLVPRMTTVQIGQISNPATGLLVFNTDNNSFFFHNGTIWQSLSSPGNEIWGVNQSTGDVFLTDLQTNIGIGTDTPLSKLALVANSGADPDAPLFEILDEFGNPIFSVTSEGVRIYVKENIGKGVSGGFAVGRYGAAKGIPDTTFFLVTGDSTRVYMKESVGKAVSGGFAVGRYGAAKGTEEYLRVTPDSTRVYTTFQNKGISGGFAVGRYGAAKGEADNFLHLTEDNYLIGHRAGDSITSGLYNLFLGYESGISDTSGSGNIFIGYQSGYMNSNGQANVFIGNNAGKSNTTGYYNVILGNDAGSSSTEGAFNVFIGNSAGSQVSTGTSNVLIGRMAGQIVTGGYNNVIIGAESGKSVQDGHGNLLMGFLSGQAIIDGYSNIMFGSESGYFNVDGRNNVFIGERAGYNNTGEYNLFLGNYAGYSETGSAKLYIENSEADENTALIYGDFTADNLRLNANTGILGPADPTYSLYVYGNAITTGNWQGSDKKWKKNINPDTYGLSSLKKLLPVSYYWRYEEFPNMNFDNRRQIGFIAQDVENIMPELVKTDKNGNKAISYSKLTPIIVKAIQEQNLEIENLKKENTMLIKEIEKLRKLIENKLPN